MAAKLSLTQRQALALLDVAPFVYNAAGWCHQGSGGIDAFATLTMTGLARRGLVKIVQRGTRKASARITPQGRKALEAAGG